MVLFSEDFQNFKAGVPMREQSPPKVVAPEISRPKQLQVNQIGLTEKGEKVVKHLKEIEEILKG